MNKKILMFSLLGIFALALVSAGIVNYLSESVSIDLELKSPLTISVTEFDVQSAEMFNLITKDFILTNNVNTIVPAIVEIEISGSSSSFSDVNVGEEFEVLMIGMKLDQSTCNAAGGINWNTDSNGYCYWDASTDKAYSGVQGGNYYVQMGDRNAPNPVPAGATLEGRLKVQFNVAIAADTYTFKSQAFSPEGSRDLA